MHMLLYTVYCNSRFLTHGRLVFSIDYNKVSFYLTRHSCIQYNYIKKSYAIRFGKVFFLIYFQIRFTSDVFYWFPLDLFLTYCKNYGRSFFELSDVISFKWGFKVKICDFGDNDGNRLPAIVWYASIFNQHVYKWECVGLGETTQIN